MQNQNNNSWITWAVPEKLALDYVFKLALFLIIIPSLFGLHFTKFGLVVNIILIDVIMYASYKTRKLL
jgi:hypothetical protein|tara:strand:+ start:58065 stop:58268 length:204 start_codon:yes stop_codon:yes gene_type:complete